MTSIFLRHADGLVEMTEQPYEAESVLQQLLAEFPQLLSGGALGAGGALLLVRREMAVADADGASGRWSLDHLFLDREAVPTLVEVKRSSDTRLRREVVGQMLDYAANATAYWDVAGLRAAFDEAHGGGELAQAAILHLLGDHAAAEPADVIDGFWERVDSNLGAGRLRLVFVADEIPRELRRIVEFLNEQMPRTEVLAIEVKQYADAAGEHRTLVPAVIGNTGKAQQVKSEGSGRRPAARIDEATLFEAIRAQQEPALAARVERLYRELLPVSTRVAWGQASATLWLGESKDADVANPMSVGFWGNWSDSGAVSVNFVHFVDKRDPDEVRALADAIRTLPGMDDVVDELARKNYKSWLPLGPALATDEGAAQLAQILITAATRRAL